jgi:hypothetical protein
MGKNKIRELIFQEYLPLYKEEGIQIKSRELRHLILKASIAAERNYWSLSEPKTCPIDVYISVCVRKAIDMDFAIRVIKPVSVNNPPHSIKASIAYFSFFPQELHKILRNRLFQTKPEKRQVVWTSFNVPIEQIEDKFKKMTKERIKMALAKGYSSYNELSLRRYKIPQSTFNEFLKNIDEVVVYCNQQVQGGFEYKNLPTWFYAEFNEPCFICSVPSFPFQKLNEVQIYVTKKHNLLERFKDKINISLGDISKMSYRNESDIFDINVERSANIRHQSVDLLHEFGHIVDYLQQFKNGVDPLERGIYLREKRALEIVFDLLHDVSPSLVQCAYNQALLYLRTTLFELSLYSNTDQDLSTLYANTFNRCFGPAKQVSNPLYILNENIIFRPFSSLPYAVAYSELIVKNSLEHQKLNN